MHEPVYLIIPAYNEAHAIGAVLSELAASPYHVIVVDDGSSDGTAEIASHYAVTVLRHAANLGQGAALQTGFDYALQRTTAETLVTFDADGQHDPADVARLLQALDEGAQVALGSRFVPGGRAIDMPRQKRLTLWLAVRITRWLTGLPLSDTHNGLRAFSRAAAAQISLRHNSMAHASEILNQVAARKLPWREVPVVIRYTPYSKRKGQSIFNSLNILWELLMGKIR
jgi:polyprenyl-phospho-N-acetylgalactosaminyl synthase